MSLCCNGVGMGVDLRHGGKQRLRTSWAVGHRSCWMPVPHWLPGRPVFLVCPKPRFVITPIETRSLAAGDRGDSWITPC